MFLEVLDKKKLIKSKYQIKLMIAQLNNVADIINYVREPGKITLRT